MSRRSDRKTDDQASVMDESHGGSLGGAVRLAGSYSEGVQAQAEAVMAAGGLKLEGILHLELLAYLARQERFDAVDDPPARFVSDMESLALQQRKHMRTILVEIGVGGSGVNETPVPMPSWLAASFVRMQAVAELLEQRLGEQLDDETRALLEQLKQAAGAPPSGDTGDTLMS